MRPALIEAGNTAVANPAQIWGNPTIDDDVKFFGNFGHLFSNSVQLYGHTNYAEKKVTEGFYFRNPNNRANIYSLDDGETLLIGDVLDARDGVVDGSANCPVVRITGNVPDPEALGRVFEDPNCFSFREIAPGGFTPQFGGVVTDMSVVGGVRGLLGNGMTWDASASFGAHESDFFFRNTVNASLGPDTPREFDPGLYRQEDTNLNFDVSYAATDMVNLAAGTEWRRERFEIGAGGRPSWEVGPYAAQGFVSGSNGFPGFPDYTAGAWNRSNVALYGDLELRDPDDRWTVGGALRFEHFDLFGATTQREAVGPAGAEQSRLPARRCQHRVPRSHARPAEHAQRADHHRPQDAATGRQRQRALHLPGGGTERRQTARAPRPRSTPPRAWWSTPDPSP